MSRFFLFTAATFLCVCGLQTIAGTDGVWRQSGSLSVPVYLWTNTENWVGGTVADGQDGIAKFDEVDTTNQVISLSGLAKTVGHLRFNDTVPNSGDGWVLTNGTLNLSVSSGISTVQVSNASAVLAKGLTMNGVTFAKTGAGTLVLRNFLNTNSINIAQGRITYHDSGTANFKYQNISGAGDVEFIGQSAGFFGFNGYLATLSYTGRTIVNLDAGTGSWWYRCLFLDRDDVLPHATVLDLLSGKVYLRSQTVNGITIAGLTGNAGTLFTTDRAGQKLTIDVANGASYTYAGTIGVDSANSASAGTLSLTKKGLGTQILSGANAFGGAVAVSGGTLLVNNTTGSGTGTNNSVTVASGATLGGIGTILSAATTLELGSVLAPGTNSVGTLTLTNLVMASGMTYQWEYDNVTNDTVCVLGTVSLPASATIVLSARDGAPLPLQGVLLTYGVTNSGTADLGGWAVNFSGPGNAITFTDDAANKRVLYTITTVPDADGVWNKAGGTPVPSYSWHNTGNWVGGTVAGGTDRTAYFDQVDSTTQLISLGGGSRTIGHMRFNDTNPTAYGFWGLHSGTLTLSVSSGSPTITVSNTNVDVGLEPSLTLKGDFTKAGPGTLLLKSFPTNSISIAEGRVTFNGSGTLNFSTQNMSGNGEVELRGNSTGYFGFNSAIRPTLSYTGHTLVNLGAGTWPFGVFFVDRDDILPHATVVDMLAGRIYLRNQQTKGITVAGLTGNSGTLLTTDWPANAIQKVTLDVADGATLSYAGTIGADAAYALSTGYITLTKKGLGTQILSGANTFVGPLAVSNGTLLASNATGSGTGTNNSVTVAAGAALGGTGTVLSTNVTFDAAAILAPGGTNRVGTLTFGGNVALADGAVYLANVTDTGSNTVVVAGALTLPDTLSVSLSVANISLPKRITLFTAGSLSGATSLSGWQSSGIGARRYLFAREGTSVVATLLPPGVLVSIR